MTHQTRRAFLSTLGAATLGAVTLPSLLDAARVPARLDRIGVQLYTVRDAMQRDLPGTLARVAEIGYREVEFAGYFGRSPAEIRRLVASHDLVAPSSHVDYALLAGDWARALDDAASAGHQWITIAWLPESARGSTRDAWRRLGDRFNTAATAATAAGLRFAYHNHDFEFASVDGQAAYDVLLQSTDATLVDFELDLYWAVKAGADPLDYFARHPGRFAMLHLKDSSGAPEHRMVDVGAGTIDFRRILAARAPAGVRHCFVEHDQPADAMASIRASYRALAALDV